MFFMMGITAVSYTHLVSAFALTSLDSVARVGRLSFQEFWLDSDTDDEMCIRDRRTPMSPAGRAV